MKKPEFEVLYLGTDIITQSGGCNEVCSEECGSHGCMAECASFCEPECEAALKY